MKNRLIHIGKPFAYILLTAFVVLTTVALVAYGQGYIFDRQSGEITGGGLALIDSKPSRAAIWINGEVVDSTPYRARRPAGTYTVGLYREGYRPWEKEVSISSGRVINLEYPILIPNNVETEIMSTLQRPRFLRQSDNQEIIAVAERANRDQVSIINVRDAEQTTIFRVPSGLSGGRITDITWSPDNSRLLVNVRSGGSNHLFFVSIDQSVDAINLNRTYGFSLGDVAFAADSVSLYSLVSGRQLRLLDPISGGSETIAEGATAYYERGRIIYAMHGDGSSQRVVRYSGSDSQQIHEINNGDSHQISFSAYDDKPVMILHNLDRDQVTLLHDLDSEVSTETLALKAAGVISLSPQKRFLLMRAGRHFQTYDFHNRQTYRFSTREASADEPAWHDGYHMLLSLEGSAVMLEYDGAHREQLTIVEPFAVVGSSRRQAVYSIGKNSLTGEHVLQRSSLE